METYKKVASKLNLAANQHNEQIFKQILGGCSSAIFGFAQLRNNFGDAHGQGTKNYSPSPRHAELAINIAGSLALFLWETYEKSGKEKNNE